MKRLTLSPHAVFSHLFSQLESDFTDHIGFSASLLDPLSQVACQALDSGEEAMSVALLAQLLDDAVRTAGTNVRSQDVINWLVGRGVLVPYSHGRAAFFHQSITEYLAARELARQFSGNSAVLRQKLTLRRWDQALFLVLGFLSQELAIKFVDSVVSVDLALALNAAKYVEHGSDEIIRLLLATLASKDIPVFELGIEGAFEKLSVSEVHKPELQALVECGDIIGGAAAFKLYELSEPKEKGRILEMLVDRCDDYNFCMEIARPLAGSLIRDQLPDARALIQKVERRLNTEAVSIEGFDSALGTMLSTVSAEDLCTTCVDFSKDLKEQRVGMSVLHAALQEQHDNEALRVAARLLAAGVPQATFTLMMVGRYAGGLDWSWFSKAHVDKCVELLDTPEHGRWAVAALKVICMNRSDLATIVYQNSLREEGVRRVGLLYASDSVGEKVLQDALAELLKFSLADIENQNCEILEEVEVDWSGRESLLAQLLRLRCESLAAAILSGILLSSRAITGDLSLSVGVNEIGDIRWWLHWLEELKAKSDVFGHMLDERLSEFLAERVTPEVIEKLVAEFNNPESPYRKVLAMKILWRVPGLTTDAFSDETISFLLRHIRTSRISVALLGASATEAFVSSALLPAYLSSTGRERKNLATILQSAGNRHGRRYISLELAKRQ